MDIIPLILPTLVLAGLLLFFVHWLTQLHSGLKQESALPSARRETRITRRDALLCAVLTVCYGIVAFAGLGDRVAPQSFCTFADRGSYARIEFHEPESVGSVLYYTGLYTGKYYVEISVDGEHFQSAGTLEQTYADLFKWRETPLDVLNVSVKALRLTSDAKLELGELALYDSAGKRISTARMRFDAGTATLFDEQELVPEDGPSYLNSSYFDEVYHPRTAYEHIRNIYPYEISHPPLGKLVIGLGVRLFGLTPFGWRFTGTLTGILMLPVLYILLKKLFGSTGVAFAGSALLAVDFMHFVQTRIATIDSYAVFFILLMYLSMYLFVSDDPDAQGVKRSRQTRNLFLCGLSFGLGAASKWTCLYAGAGLAVIWLLYWIFRGVKLRKSGRGDEFLPEFAGNVGLCLVFFVCIPAIIYYLCYIPYGRAKGMHGFAMLLDKDYLQLVWKNQTFMYRYHAGVDATHPYSSTWYQWLLNIRPILYYLDYPTETTKSSIAALLNPVICWGGLLALAATAWLGWRTRDKKALFILLGYLAQLLPWVAITRVVFAYHYFTSVPFLILSLCYVFDALRRVDPAWKKRVGGVVLVSAALFVLFYPALTGVSIPRWYSHNILDWLPAWPL